MNGNTLLDIVMLRLVRTDTVLRAALLAELNNLIHTRLEAGIFIPWFLQQDNQTVSTGISQEYVVLPTGFLRFDDDMEKGGVWYQDTTLTTPDQWVELTRSQYNRMKGLYADSVAAVPELYDLMQGRIYLRPFPDAVYPLRILGMFADADIVDAATPTLWTQNASDLLISELTLVGATLYTRDSDLVEIAIAERNASMTRLRGAHTAIIESMQERTMGDD